MVKVLPLFQKKKNEYRKGFNVFQINSWMKKSFVYILSFYLRTGLLNLDFVTVEMIVRRQELFDISVLFVIVIRNIFLKI